MLLVEVLTNSAEKISEKLRPQGEDEQSKCMRSDHTVSQPQILNC